jgi:hypothetical protein
MYNQIGTHHDRFMVRENGTEDFSHADWIRTFAEAAEDVKQQMKAQGRDDEFIGAKVSAAPGVKCPSHNRSDHQIIYTTLRFMTADELEWYTEDCIQLKQQFPNVIAGMTTAILSKWYSPDFDLGKDSILLVRKIRDNHFSTTSSRYYASRSESKISALIYLSYSTLGKH